MRPGGAVRVFALELARGPGAAVRAGERLRGRVLLEAAGPLRVRALEVAARGGAAAHWLEARSVGGRAVPSDFAATETLLRRRQLLLPGEARGPQPDPPGTPARALVSRTRPLTRGLRARTPPPGAGPRERST
ncbi:PREDICTED: arrestin domain-containing protein 2-like [Chinchilla lanigera]|uniref:arrestin domain-containing protein 2-like n=1 Tax=Chinchilla lanigera TaxID=34839 RepID=UPI0006964E75|nr:PREDICTED: arrestin domain-containing protein 2-like [Chinchilla lanigera]